MGKDWEAERQHQKYEGKEKYWRMVQREKKAANGGAGVVLAAVPAAPIELFDEAALMSSLTEEQKERMNEDLAKAERKSQHERFYAEQDGQMKDWESERQHQKYEVKEKYW